jgi:hypothetical protein
LEELFKISNAALKEMIDEWLSLYMCQVIGDIKEIPSLVT